jgi:23S rRNA (uracil1939-C5)-methyltransferase
MAAGGSALARDDDGRVVFVDGAIPNELVDVEVFDEHSDYARAAVVTVVEPAEGRVAPPCPYVGAGCGGCGWQHIAPSLQSELKRDIVLDALRRIGRLASPDVSVGTPLPPTGYRTTVRMAVVAGRAAFHGHRSHELVPIDRCLVAHPLLQDLIGWGRYEGATEVTLRCGAATGERLVLAAPHAHGVEVADDVVVIGANEVKRGRTARIHEIVAGRRFLISATSFFQARLDGAEALVDAVRADFVDDEEPGTFVDAYCGVGLFAGLLGAGRKIVAVERHGPAVRDARDNLGGDAQVVRAEVAAWNPVPARVIVADPARPGLGGKAAARLVATGATRLILVSCDPASLARDTAVLTGLGFAHRRSTLVDLFPHTPHVEVVTRFDRVG